MVDFYTAMQRILFVAVALSSLTACAVEPPRPSRPVAPAQPPPPATDVYAYPLKGQSAEQQDRDRYECYGWAVKQTGFDPSAPERGPHERVRIVDAPPPGSTTAAGAVTGAAMGAIVSGPHDTAEGAVVGAIAGAVIGAAAEQQQAQRVEAAESERRAQEHAAASERASSYRRALSACFEARGYSVR